MLPRISLNVSTPKQQSRTSITNFEVLYPKSKYIQTPLSQAQEDPLIIEFPRFKESDDQISINLLNLRRHNKFHSTIQKTRVIQREQRKKDTVKICAQKFRSATQVKSIKSLTEHQIYSINDQASDFQEPLKKFKQEIDVDEQGKEFKRLHRIKSQGQYLQGDFYQLVMKVINDRNSKFNHRNILSRIFKHPIRPSHPFLILWNFLKIGLILHTFIAYPLQDAFGNRFSQIECESFSGVITIEFFFLILDIFLRFNMSIYNQGELIVNRQQIAVIYLKRGLALDLVALCGFMIDRQFIVFGTNDCKDFQQLGSGILSFLKYTSFLRLSQLRKFLKFLRHELDPVNKYNSYVQLTQLLCLVIMMAHIIASAWIGIGFYSMETYSTSWIDEKNLQDAPWHLTYVMALYFACMTMTTVGYGDVLPKNEIEYIVCIGIMLISCAIFAYTLNTITTVLSEINKSQSSNKKDLEIIQNYLIKKGVDNNLQRRVKKYLKTMWKSGQLDPMNQEITVFNRLSSQIQQDIQLQDKGRQLLKIPFLVNNFSHDFIQRLIKVVQEINYSPQEIIMTQKLNEFNIGMFIVYKGEVDMVFEKQQHSDKKKLDVTHLASLNVGDYYGIKQLFQIPQEKFTLISKNFTILYYLTVQDFMNILLDETTLQSDLERYCMIRDQILFQNIQDLIYQPCYSCDKEGHDLISCQNLFFQPNKYLAIAKYNFSQDQIRDKQISRRFTTRVHALKSKDFMNERLQHLRDEMSNISALSDDSQSDSDEGKDKNQNDQKSEFVELDNIQLDGTKSQRSVQSWKVDDQNEYEHPQIPNQNSNQMESQKDYNLVKDLKRSKSSHIKTVTAKKASFFFADMPNNDQSEQPSSLIMKNSLQTKRQRKQKSSNHISQSNEQILFKEAVTKIKDSYLDIQRDSDIENFELGKNYKIYFQAQNMDFVIEKVNKYLAMKSAVTIALRQSSITKSKRPKWLNMKIRKGLK